MADENPKGEQVKKPAPAKQTAPPSKATPTWPTQTKPVRAANDASSGAPVRDKPAKGGKPRHRKCHAMRQNRAPNARSLRHVRPASPNPAAARACRVPHVPESRLVAMRDVVPGAAGRTAPRATAGPARQRRVRTTATSCTASESLTLPPPTRSRVAAAAWSARQRHPGGGRGGWDSNRGSGARAAPRFGRSRPRPPAPAERPPTERRKFIRRRSSCSASGRSGPARRIVSRTPSNLTPDLRWSPRRGPAGGGGAARPAPTGAAVSRSAARPAAAPITEIIIPDPITVRELAEKMHRSAIDVIKALMNYGIMVPITQTIDFDTAQVVGERPGDHGQARSGARARGRRGRGGSAHDAAPADHGPRES